MPDDTIKIIIHHMTTNGGPHGLPPRWFEKHVNAEGDHLRWCTFDGDAWHGHYPCNCHESYMEDFPDMPTVIAAWMLGGRAAVHAMELDLLSRGFADRK